MMSSWPMIIDFDDPTIMTNDFQTVGSNGLIVGNNDLKSLVIKKSLVQKVSVVMYHIPVPNYRFVETGNHP